MEVGASIWPVLLNTDPCAGLLTIITIIIIIMSTAMTHCIMVHLMYAVWKYIGGKDGSLGKVGLPAKQRYAQRILCPVLMKDISSASMLNDCVCACMLWLYSDMIAERFKRTKVESPQRPAAAAAREEKGEL